MPPHHNRKESENDNVFTWLLGYIRHNKSQSHFLTLWKQHSVDGRRASLRRQIASVLKTLKRLPKFKPHSWPVDWGRRDLVKTFSRRL